jgi:hypothetical protein
MLLGAQMYLLQEKIILLLFVVQQVDKAQSSI